MPVWHTFKCPKSQGSPSGFYKGLAVGYDSRTACDSEHDSAAHKKGMQKSS